MEKYSPLVIEYIEARQKNVLMAKYGIGFEEKLSEIFPPTNSFLDFIEKDLELEFGDNYDERFELEALLKNDAISKIPNITKYEFPQHRRILYDAENTFKLAISGVFEENIPYNTTLYSNEINAEIIQYECLDKPIIFFHGGLFVANLLLCKLYVQLIICEESKDVNKYKIYKSEIPETNAAVSLLAVYFFNHYFSGISEVVPTYSLKSNYEKSILSILLESISLFIFSHEVGHASYPKHLTNKEKTTKEKWDNEYEADLYALNRIINLYRKKEDSSPFILIGPVIFFKYLILVEKYKAGMNPEDSHPPTIERLKLYYFYLFNLTNEDEHEIIKQFLTLEEEISKTLISVFDKCSKIKSKLPV